jgi:uncharacterized cupredoxin-like copper-binding protein
MGVLGSVLLLGVPAGAAGIGMGAADVSMRDSMPGMHGPAGGGQGFVFGEPGKLSQVDRVVSIAMQEMSFEPSLLDVRIGETIRFVVTNRSEVDHDFTIGDAVTQTAHRKEMLEAMDKGGEMDHGSDPNAISVEAGRNGELIWKFTRAGRFEFDCNVPGHFEAGMRGVIAVESKGSDRG